MSTLPLENGSVASGYLDPKRDPPHFGVDLVSIGGAGSSVHAPEAGVVVDTSIAPDPTIADNTNFESCAGLAGGALCKLRDRKWAPWTGYGPGIVVIKGGSGAFHLLAHLATLGVAKGDAVHEGQVVGQTATHVGKSGSHVHWEVRTVEIDGPETRGADTTDPMLWLADNVSVSSSAPAAATPATVPGGGKLLADEVTATVQKIKNQQIGKYAMMGLFVWWVFKKRR